MAVPFSLVVVLIVIYIGCIGPLDYFILKKVLRRMELTWITFPAFVIAFTAIGYLLAHHLKGEQLRLNYVDLVDVDTSSGLIRGTMWTTIFSPDTELYNLSLQAGLPASARASSADVPPGQSAGKSANQPVDAEVLLSWMGLPGSGFGGMSQRTPSASLFNSSYRFSPGLSRLEDMPISVWSTKTLTARWLAKQPGLMSATLRDNGDRLLSGSIRNDSQLRLTEAVLVYDRWAFPLGTIEAGGSIALDGRIDPQTVDTYFKHVSIVDGRDMTRPYGTEDVNVPPIMEALMFYQATGGEKHTRLSDTYLSYLDAVRQLREGRAVLMGRCDQPATELLRDDRALGGSEQQHWTYYRFMLPVQPAEH